MDCPARAWAHDGIAMVARIENEGIEAVRHCGVAFPVRLTGGLTRTNSMAPIPLSREPCVVLPHQRHSKPTRCLDASPNGIDDTDVRSKHLRWFWGNSTCAT